MVPGLVGVHAQSVSIVAFVPAAALTSATFRALAINDDIPNTSAHGSIHFSHCINGWPRRVKRRPMVMRPGWCAVARPAPMAKETR